MEGWALTRIKRSGNSVHGECILAFAYQWHTLLPVRNQASNRVIEILDCAGLGRMGCNAMHKMQEVLDHYMQ